MTKENIKCTNDELICYTIKCKCHYLAKCYKKPLNLYYNPNDLQHVYLHTHTEFGYYLKDKLILSRH